MNSPNRFHCFQLSACIHHCVFDQIQVDITLEEIRRLQEEEPAVNDDVETVLELEQREYENFQEVQLGCSLNFDLPMCG